MSNQHTSKKYDKDEIIEIIRLYNSGISFTKIGLLLQRQKNNIKKILIDNKVWDENRGKLDEKKVIELYKNGLSLASIGEKFGVSKEPITRIVKSVGILRTGFSDGKKIKLTLNEDNKIKELYLTEYKSILEIATELNLSAPFICSYLSKSGYRRNKTEGTSVGTVKRYGRDYNEYLDNRDKYQIYYSKVMSITNKQAIEELENYDKRGVSGNKGAYQLDHKFSILEGFKQDIHPSLIGGINNLEFIPWEDNARKRTNCSITLKELKQ